MGEKLTLEVDKTFAITLGKNMSKQVKSEGFDAIIKSKGVLNFLASLMKAGVDPKKELELQDDLVNFIIEFVY